MTFKGKIDTWWYLATAFINGIAISALIYQGLRHQISGLLLINLLALLLLNLYFVPPILKNEVVVSKKEVIVRFGLLTKVIPIQGISVVRTMTSYSGSFAASFDRIGIECRGMSAVFIALEDNKSFIKELMRKNRKIKYLM